MSETRTRVSIGVAGVLGPDVIARIARAVESTGFDGLWVNDTPDGDAIAALGAAAQVTERITLATGVVPLDRRPASELARDIDAAELPADRLVLGVGSGAARTGQLALVRGGVAELREHTDARIVVGALGPKMRALGADDADGVLLSWLTPDAAAEQAAEAHALDSSAHVALYVRTAFDPDARARMQREADRYASFPNYAANFERLGFDVGQTVLPQPDVQHARTGLRDYLDSVDELVLRAIVAEDDIVAYSAFATDAAGAIASARERAA